MVFLTILLCLLALCFPVFPDRALAA